MAPATPLREKSLIPARLWFPVTRLGFIQGLQDPKVSLLEQ